MTFFGKGLLTGLAVTLKNFIASFIRPPEQGGLFTVQYPEQRIPPRENYRNFPFLVYDGMPANLRCVACDICAKECPPKCIYIVRDTDAEGKPLKRPKIFEIDFSLCMSCGICEEVCPFDAIMMDHEYEITSPERQEGLLKGIDELSRSNDYFRKIKPHAAKTIDQKREKAAAPKAVPLQGD
ncbi:MAG: 4Fe-4S binding protein [Candidatus Omnitrophota bacterium]